MMEFTDAGGMLSRLVADAGAQFHKMPGSAILLRYIRSSYQNDPVRSVVELVLFLFFLRYILSSKYSTHNGARAQLTEDEIDDLVDDWTPEPLVAPCTPFEEIENERRPVIVGASGPKVKLANSRAVTNLASHNFYNLISSEKLKERSISTLRTYGVGPCGPPGFYGTQDVHMKVEQDIAAHLGVPACIVYAQAFSTISSVIPAFSKRGDIIVADRAVNYAVRKGIQISRSTVRWYEHNDYEDLKRVLEKVTREQKGKPLTRRFIVTEALFENVGDIADLPKLVELKTRYKFRLILDECQSYGTLGPLTARGLTELQNVDPNSVDMIVGSLAGPICAGGGFCAGSDEVVEHQRISAAAYTFSAALPAMLATNASEVVGWLQGEGGREGEERVGAGPFAGKGGLGEVLRERARDMRAQLDPRSDWVRCSSAPENPTLLLSLKPEVVEARNLSVDDEEAILQEVVDECQTNNVLITRLKQMPPPHGASPRDLASVWQPHPALKVCVTTGLSRKDTERAGVVIRHAITAVMKRKR